MSQPPEPTLSWFERRRPFVGPAVTLLVALLLAAIRPFSPLFPNPLAFSMFAVVFAAAYSGLWPGLISAGIIWLYFLWGYLFYGSLIPGVPDGGQGLVATGAISLPLTAIVTGLLRRRIEQQAGAALAREREHNARLEQALAERERAEQSLEHNRSLWQTVLDTASDLIYMKDRDGRYVLVNTALVQSLGLAAPEEVVGKTDADLFPPKYAALYQAEDREVMESGSSVLNRESPGPGPDGHELWALTNIAPWRDEQGNIAGVVGFSRDITERILALAGLREAEAQFRGLVERLPVIVYALELGQSNRLIYVSPQIESKLGVTPAEYLTGVDMWRTLLHPDDHDRVVAEIERVRRTGEPLDIEYRLVARDGRVVWIRDQAARLVEADGTSRFAQGLMLDITDYKVAEQARRDSEERYELVTWATNDAVWDWDIASDTVWTNEGLQRLFQYGGESEARPFAWWNEQIHPADRERIISSLRRAVAGDDQFWSREYRFRRADGTYADVFDRAYILRNPTGQAKRMVGAMSDISERKRIEQALIDAEGKYRTLVEQLPAVVYLAENGESGHWHYVSPQIQTLLDFSPAEWLSDSGLWARQLHPEDRQRVLAAEVEDRHVPAGTAGVIEYRLFTRDGRTVWVRDSAIIMPGRGDGSHIYHGVLTDITEQKRGQTALQEANQILTQWLQHSERRTMELGLLNELSSLMQNCHDVDEACRSAQPILRRLFADDYLGLYSVPAGQDISRPVWADRAVSAEPFDPEECWAFRRKQIYVVDAEHPGPVCGHLGADVPEAYLCVPISVQGRPLAILHIRKASAEGDDAGGRAQSINDSQQQLARTVSDSMGLSFANLELRDTLREQSIRDPLTGLYNRRYMEESLEREIYRADRHQRSVSVVMLDIDHFKVFNDAYGHPAGDMLLRELGRILREHIRGADIACRYDGEEFTLILPEASLEATRQRAEQLRREAANLRPQIGGHTPSNITVSMGVACYPQHGANAEEMLRAADNALYQAKREGRNRVHVHP